MDPWLREIIAVFIKELLGLLAKMFINWWLERKKPPHTKDRD